MGTPDGVQRVSNKSPLAEVGLMLSYPKKRTQRCPWGQRGALQGADPGGTKCSQRHRAPGRRNAQTGRIVVKRDG
jgi:hypothetical protein